MVDGIYHAETHPGLIGLARLKPEVTLEQRQSQHGFDPQSVWTDLSRQQTRLIVVTIEPTDEKTV